MTHAPARTRNRGAANPKSCAATARQAIRPRARLLPQSILSALLGAPCAIAGAQADPARLFEGLEKEYALPGGKPIYFEANSARLVEPLPGRYAYARDKFELRGAAGHSVAYTLRENAALSLDQSKIGNDARHGIAVLAEAGSRLELTGGTRVSTLDDSSSAVHLGRDATVVMRKDTILETMGADSNAITMEPGASLVLDGAAIRTRGDSAPGIFHNAGRSASERSDSGLDIRNTTIGTIGDGAAGVVSVGAHDKPVRISSSHLETAGFNASGVRIMDASLTMTGATNVTTHGNSSTAVVLQDLPSATIDGAELRTRGTASAGIDMKRSNATLQDTRILTMGARSTGLAAAASTVRLKNTSVLAMNSEAYAAVLSGSRLDAEGSVIQSRSHSVFLVNDSAGADTSITLQNTRTHPTEDPADSSTPAAVRRPLLHVDHMGGKPGTVAIRLLDGSSAHGSITRANDGESTHRIAMMISDSVWRGHTVAVDHMTIADSGYWRLSDNSRVGDLILQDGMIVFDRIGDAPAHTLDVSGNLDGKGKFYMNANFATQRANRLNIGKQANGHFRVLVHATGSEPGQKTLRLIEAHKGGNAQFTLANRGGRTELGVYQYELRRHQSGSATAWDLVPASDTKQHGDPKRSLPDGNGSNGGGLNGGGLNGSGTGGGMPAGAVPHEGPPDAGLPATSVPATTASGPVQEGSGTKAPDAGTPDAQATASALAATPSGPATTPALRLGKPRLSALASDVVNTSGFASTQRIWNTEIGALGQRSDTLRSDAAGPGVWADGFGARQQLDNGTGRPFSQELEGFHIGADRVFAVQGGRGHMGVAGGYSSTRRDFSDEGKGSTNGLHAGLYAGMRHDSGFYVQGALGAGRFRNRLSAVGSDYMTSTAHYRNTGVGLSLTAGRRWDLERGWFVEPLAGADYFYLGNARYRTSNGMTVDVRSADSMQLRAALRAGKRIELASGGAISPYAQVGGVQEFGGGTRTTLNGIDLDSRVDGARLETRIGLDARLGPRHTFFAGYTYAKSGNYEQPWALNAGYRYAF